MHPVQVVLRSDQEDSIPIQVIYATKQYDNATVYDHYSTTSILYDITNDNTVNITVQAAVFIDIIVSYNPYDLSDKYTCGIDNEIGHENNTLSGRHFNIEHIESNNFSAFHSDFIFHANIVNVNCFKYFYKAPILI